MDWLENLLPFLLFIIYFLSQIRKAARRRDGADPDELAPTEETERAPTAFEDLIRQIHEATQPQTPPAEAPSKPALPRPTTGAAVPASRLRPTEFRPVGQFAHEEHGFGAANPFSEEVFERLPQGQVVTAHAPGHLDSGPHNLTAPLVPRTVHPFAARLRTPTKLKEAFALREILDAPRSRRGRHR